MRQSVLFVLALLLCVTQVAGADCSTLADSTIRWIVPTKPGGGYDAYSRLLQPFMERELGAQIVIENRAEAGGIVAALTIRDATPDGKTLGIINASGLLTANMLAENPAPHPATDFTVLGRVISNHFVVFTGRDSGIADMEDLLSVAKTRPVLVAVRDVGSTSFAALPVTASLIGMDYAVVTGYVGNSDRALAAIRGEVDVVMHNFDSARRFVDSGELVPLLQLTREMANFYAALAGVPTLAGEDGLARQRARVTGRTPEQAELEARALASIVGAGRLLVAPPNLSTSMAGCLRGAVNTVLAKPELLSAAERAGLSVVPADSAAALEDLRVGEEALAQFATLVRAAVEGTRQ